MRYELIPYVYTCTSTNPLSFGTGTSVWPWVFPLAQICCPKAAPVLPFQDCYKTMLCLFLISSPGKTSLPYTVILSLTFLLLARLNPSAVELSCPPCQIICQSQITTAEQLPVEFSLQKSGERQRKRLFKKHKKKTCERIAIQTSIKLITISEVMQFFVLEE